ncbi:SusC/RagA family TonB-linked outer membrane protein [Eisenibacter elegans]|uniref:SusC/RagA family TonB-linked outer membrane protein n=1 Tax=Eisenibacter elegans TaxID=997 RepID=UPI0003FBDBCD|nr:TonB-dependent receptor [Eisenibacter elegans]
MNRGLLLSLTLLLSLLYVGVFAQGRTVTGTVTDESGDPIPGVTVVVKGTTQGTATDINGRYSITVPENAVLVFSGVGLTAQEVVVGNQTNISPTINSDVKTLGEVVVVGYGTQEKREVTGAITQIKGADIANLATTSFDQQLAGRAAGLTVTVPSGVLGESPRIRVRGTNSITSGSSPLIVIDGVPMFSGNLSNGTTVNNALADLNPNDIESFEVLKDGAATAIYGSRAANGVLLITTKRGKAGRSKLTYDTWFGWSQAANRFDLLNADEFVQIQNEKLAAAGDPALFNVSGINTNWQDLIFRTGFQQSHNVSLSGGTERTTYFFSANWTKQEGFVQSNEFQRAAIRANVDQKVTNWLKAGMSTSLARSQNIGLNTGRNSLSGNITNASRLWPNVSPFDANHPTGFNIEAGNRLGRGVNGVPITFNYPNIAFVLANNLNNSSSYRLLNNVYAEVNIPGIEGLTIRTQYATDIAFVDDFTFWDSRHGDGFGSNGLVSQGASTYMRWNWQNTINYSKTFADVHKIGVIVGVEYQQDKNRAAIAQGQNLTNDFFGRTNIVSGSFETPTVTGGATQNGFDSYFGRLNYALKDRYLFNISVRNDGISALLPPNRRGTFVGGSVGWRIYEEGFFQNALGNIFSDFKIRASYAQVGNVDIGNFPAVGTFGIAQYGSQLGISYNRLGNVANPDLQWEVSNKLDVGVEFGLLSNRVSVEFDYYRNDIDKLILATPTAPSLGLPDNSINRNIGGIVNSGIELHIAAAVLETNGGFRWNTDFNFSTNRNEITALNNNEDILFTYNINRVGQPIGSIYGFDFVGVNSANGNPIYRKANGDLVQYHLTNGVSGSYRVFNPANPANIAEAATLTANDRVLLGNPNPTWFGGWSNNFSYKGFDMEIFLRFSGGNKIMNVTRQELLSLNFVNNGREILERWTTPGQQTNVPRMGSGTGATNFLYNSGFADSRFVEAGDFLRIQNIVLGYTLPKQIVERVNMQRLRLYAQMQNVLVFTKYKGLDPELNANPNSNSQFGIDFNGNPLPRTITFGLNATF